MKENISIFKKGFKADETLDEKVSKEVAKIQKMLPDDAKIKVTFVKTKDRMKCDVLTSLSNSFIKGEARTTIPMADEDEYDEVVNLTAEDCVNKAVDDLRRKTRKLRTALIDKRRKPEIDKLALDLKYVYPEVDEEPEEDFATLLENEGKEKVSKSGEIRRIKEVELNFMSYEEAIVQMEMLGHTFFMFKDENGITSVVYKRKNNKGYGVIKENDN